MRGLLLMAVGVLLLVGCPPLPDPDPSAAEPPGFSPCSPNEQALALAYSVCPMDPDFPYGTTVEGTVSRQTQDILELEAEDGRVWLLDFTADEALFDEGPDWTDEGSGPVELTVSAPCADEDEHWFEVARGARLLVAGGTATYAELQDGTWTVGRSPRQDILTSICESDLRSCACWEQCYAIPIGFQHGGVYLAELYSAERTRRGRYDAIVFDAWRGVGEPTCAGARPEEGRWLILDN